MKVTTTVNQDSIEIKLIPKTLSFGERMVRTNFNPANNSEVDILKQKFAQILNDLDARRTATEENEVKRWLSESITLTETSALFAVKAITHTK